MHGLILYRENHDGHDHYMYIETNTIKLFQA